MLEPLELDAICPGHGPLVTDARAKIEEYLDHRLAREDALLAALDDGLRTQDELLGAVWSDAPEALRPAAVKARDTTVCRPRQIRPTSCSTRPGSGNLERTGAAALPSAGCGCATASRCSPR